MKRPWKCCILWLPEQDSAKFLCPNNVLTCAPASARPLDTSSPIPRAPPGQLSVLNLHQTQVDIPVTAATFPRKSKAFETCLFSGFDSVILRLGFESSLVVTAHRERTSICSQFSFRSENIDICSMATCPAFLIKSCPVAAERSSKRRRPNPNIRLPEQGSEPRSETTIWLMTCPHLEAKPIQILFRYRLY